MAESWLQGANMTGADPSGAELTRANLIGTLVTEEPFQVGGTLQGASLPESTAFGD